MTERKPYDGGKCIVCGEQQQGTIHVNYNDGAITFLPVCDKHASQLMAEFENWANFNKK